jgi:hypothetical protein
MSKPTQTKALNQSPSTSFGRKIRVWILYMCVGVLWTANLHLKEISACLGSWKYYFLFSLFIQISKQNGRRHKNPHSCMYYKSISRKINKKYFFISRRIER